MISLGLYVSTVAHNKGCDRLHVYTISALLTSTKCLRPTFSAASIDHAVGNVTILKVQVKVVGQPKCSGK